MAANYSKGRVLMTAGSLAKRFAANRVLASNSRPSPFTGTVALYSSSSSSSSYDKNVDEHVRPAVVPDHMIAPDSDKYWGPHPKTGVFGPAGSGAHRDAAAGDGGPSTRAPSVMDQTAWFRPLEDVDKPPPPPPPPPSLA